MARNGDIRSTFKAVPKKRPLTTQNDGFMLDNITLSSSDVSTNSSTDVSGSKREKGSKKISHTDKNSNGTKQHTISNGPSLRLNLTNERGSEESSAKGMKSPVKLRISPRKKQAPSLSLPPAAQDPESMDEDDLPTPKAVQRPRTDASAANISFDSTSTLSAPPPSSQMSVGSSSMRIVKDGQEMVTNSSSDVEILETDEVEKASDSADSDSEDDIEALIARKRQTLAVERTSMSTEPEELKKEGYDLRDRDSKRVKRHPHSPSSKSYPTPPRKDSKRSLQALLERHRAEAEVEEKIRAMEEHTRMADERLAAQQKALDDDDGEMAINAEQTLNAQDDTDFQVKRALRNVDALEQEVRFHFFDSVLEQDPTRLPFPETTKEWHECVQILKEDDSRDQAVTSGFLADLCRVKALPLELQEWFLGEIIFEDRDEISHAYVHILAECAKHEPISSLLDLPMLRDSMTRLGARDEIIYEAPAGAEEPAPPDLRRLVKTGRRGLSNFLLLLSRLRDRLSPKTQEAALYFCSLMLLDADLSMHAPLLARAEQTISDLMSGIPTAQVETLTPRLASRLLRKVEHPVLRSRLLSRLPSYPPHAALFQRQTAFLATTGHFPTVNELRDEALWQTVLSAAKGNQDFRTGEGADYAALAARFAMLDLAAGNGFGAFEFLGRPEEGVLRPWVGKMEEKKGQSRNRSRDGSRGISAQGTREGSEEVDGEGIGEGEGGKKVHSIFTKKYKVEKIDEREMQYNQRVKEVASWAGALNKSIRDVGASGVRKTECKATIAVFVRRLENAVRTRERDRKSVF
ncbi:hypothetical protein B9Z65_7393 [Elsinoe australis]|uniref:Uncharacterized protein n=1 Tax=Elsinoe australis TaxID=40998 RepID=A0A2P7YC12_9PEZI|nr:hypothetical protein B9Z65_7393 [Elsinoe australis]